MFGLGIHYLMGWSMAASDGAKKELAEWPPHPDRVFMALAAAWFETGQDEREGEALRWFEQLPAPGVHAPDCEKRTVATCYVPVNDTKIATAKKVSALCDNARTTWSSLVEAGLALLPEHRSRQPRAFPVAIPHAPLVYLCWNETLAPEQHAGLRSLCGKVVSIGHSASLVHVWILNEPPEPNLIPVAGLARHRLRVSGPGRLHYLEKRHNRSAVVQFRDRAEKIGLAKGRDKKRLQVIQSDQFPDRPPVTLRPEPTGWQGYDHPKPRLSDTVPGSLFDPRLMILALSGRRVTLAATLKLTEALRGTLLSHCSEPIPEWLSGHAPDGTRSTKPHLACLPMPFSGAAHADGRLMGVALALPRDTDPDDVERVLAPWLWDVRSGTPRKHALFASQWLDCAVTLETRENPPYNLQAEAWTRPSRRWASVTPVVLDRHFSGPRKWDMAAEIVKDGCERIGLPRPVDVLLHPVSLVQGVPRSNEFPWISRKQDGGRMHHSHAVLLFEQKVCGPILVGAGRYRGYGLFRPLIQGGDVHG